jgi:hypothetical protein
MSLEMKMRTAHRYHVRPAPGDLHALRALGSPDSMKIHGVGRDRRRRVLVGRREA